MFRRFQFLLAGLICWIALSPDAADGMPWVTVSSDKKAFALEPSARPFVPWGFNYDHDANGRLIEDYWETEWPTVESHFEQIRNLGANVVRIHLQFGKFMDSPQKPNSKALARLGKLLELAEGLRLYLDLTGLGCYHKQDVPAWYDRLSEQERWAAQARFWQAITSRCAATPAVFCYDLMNEPIVPGGRRRAGEWLAPPFAGKHFVQFISLDQADRPRPEIARRWIHQLTAAIREKDRRHLITVGLVDTSLDRPGLPSGFVPEKVADDLDFISVHLYPKRGQVDEALKTLAACAAGVALFGSPPPNNATPLQNSGNSILANSISQNGLNNPAATGIDLSNQFVYPKDDGATPGNAPHGAANDPNNFQSFPTLTAVTPNGSSTTIGGHLIQAASPNTSFRIEFFANDFNMSGGHYEGQNFLGATNVTTNAAGQASFLVTLNVPVAVGRFLTATATNLTPDPSSQAGAVNVFNTSELSPALFVGNANQAFVFKVFRDLLGRLPDPGGLAAFAQLMSQGFSPTQVVQTIEGSLEYRAREVQNLYTRLLHRSADAGGLIAFANMLGAGGTVAQVEVGLLASGEYFANRGGGTDAGFVNALYLDVLGRSADASAESWVNALNSQSLTRAQVAADILNSGEGLRDLVQGFYTEFLFRSASSSELNVWVHALQNGVSQEAALAAILGSTESFHNPGF
jgi:hypothetical protein